jgi:hypothetical protein
MDLFQENVIVTASNFNVTLISQVWLIDNGIVRRDEFSDAMIFTPAIVQFQTPHFDFLAIPTQLQFEPKGTDEEKQKIIVERLGKFVQTLPHTPYTAMGVNFTWHYKPAPPKTVAQVSRSAFFKSDAKFAKFFSSHDAKFGAYYSKDELGFRLRLNIGPIDIPRPDEAPEEAIQLAFNYHLDANREEDIRSAMERWSRAKQHSTELANEIEKSL